MNRRIRKEETEKMLDQGRYMAGSWQLVDERRQARAVSNTNRRRELDKQVQQKLRRDKREWLNKQCQSGPYAGFSEGGFENRNEKESN